MWPDLAQAVLDPLEEPPVAGLKQAAPEDDLDLFVDEFESFDGGPDEGDAFVREPIDDLPRHGVLLSRLEDERSELA